MAKGTILRAMDAPRIWKSEFSGDSWNSWRAFLAALFALPMTEKMLALYRECTGRQTAPSVPFSEGALVCGRRSGKTRILALVACYLAAFIEWQDHLAAGEYATIAVLCADRAQARVLIRYCKGLLAAVPELQALTDGAVEHSQRITLPSRRVTIEITTASFQLARGYSFAAVLADEVAFWSTAEDGARPDTEIVRAIKPGLLTLRPAGSVLLLASSPYSRRGVLWETHKRHYAEDTSPVLVWKAPTLVMNPTVDAGEIERARREDPDGASSEYDAEFRTDLSALLPREVVEACVIPHRHELPPAGGTQYRAFCDPSGGSSDSMCLGIAHAEQRDTGRGSVRIGVLDVLVERRPPFNPDVVCEEFAEIIRRYRLHECTGDRYAAEWVTSRFDGHGIKYVPTEQTKSEIYLAALPLLNGGRVELLDSPKRNSPRSSARPGAALVAMWWIIRRVHMTTAPTLRLAVSRWWPVRQIGWMCGWDALGKASGRSRPSHERTMTMGRILTLDAFTRWRDEAEAVPMGYGAGAETAPGLEDIADRVGSLENAFAVLAGYLEQSDINAGGSGFPGGQAEDEAYEFGGSRRKDDPDDPGSIPDQMAARTPAKDELPDTPTDINNRNRQFWSGTNSVSMTSGSQSTPAPGAGREAEGARYQPNAAGSIDVPRAFSKTPKQLDAGWTSGVGKTADARTLRAVEVRGTDRMQAQLRRMNQRNAAVLR